MAWCIRYNVQLTTKLSVCIVKICTEPIAIRSTVQVFFVSIPYNIHNGVFKMIKL